MKSSSRQVIFAVVLLISVIGLLELLLRPLAFVSPRVDQLLAVPWAPPAIPDVRLGQRPSPMYPGHDRKGFRNQEVPARVQIVALGDSQTYGTGVQPGNTWPRQLESMTGKKVYSMAFGGYGPTHSLILWDEAVALSPSIVVEALYAGNDLYDSFDHVYNQGQLPELRSSDPQVQASVRASEQAEPLAQRVSRLFQMGTTPVTVDRDATLPFRNGVFFWGSLAQHSKLYALLRRARYETARLGKKPNSTLPENWDTARAFAAARPASCQVFNDGQFRTVFTSEYRLSALDLGDPRIAEGLQVSLRAILRMHERAVAAHIRFLVVLIPTKEAVFRQRWPDPPPSYRRLAALEEQVWSITKDFFEHHDIEYVDALPALQEQLVKGAQPYQVSIDGHPNEHGHGALAACVADYLSVSKTTQARDERHTVANADKPLR